jgi:hypothetical protein
VAIVNYGDLLCGSGNKTFAGVTTIAGDLVISDTAVALLFNNTGSSTGTLTLGEIFKQLWVHMEERVQPLQLQMELGLAQLQLELLMYLVHA